MLAFRRQPSRLLIRCYLNQHALWSRDATKRRGTAAKFDAECHSAILQICASVQSGASPYQKGRGAGSLGWSTISGTLFLLRLVKQVLALAVGSGQPTKGKFAWGGFYIKNTPNYRSHITTHCRQTPLIHKLGLSRKVITVTSACQEGWQIYHSSLMSTLRVDVLGLLHPMSRHRHSVRE